MMANVTGELMANCSNSSTASNKTNGEIYNKLSSVPIFLSIYIVILMFAIVGNGLVCWIVKVNPRMHDVMNCLLVNLAVSDLIQTISSVFHVVDFVVKDLNLGDVGCKFQINMFNIPYGVSVLSLIFIAYERYCAICKPMDFRDNKKRMRWIIPLTWLISTCIFSPTIYYCGSRLNKEKNQLTCDCTHRWPSLTAKNAHGMFMVVALYVVPLIAVVGFYSVVIRRLRVAPPGEDEGTMKIYKSRQKVVKMMVVTVVLFFLSWTPYNVLYFLKRLEVDFRKIYKSVWYPALLLSFLSCAYNPVIYCFLSKNFREGFKSVFRCCRVFRPGKRTNALSTQSTSTSRSSRRINVENVV